MVMGDLMLVQVVVSEEMHGWIGIYGGHGIACVVKPGWPGVLRMVWW